MTQEQAARIHTMISLSRLIARVDDGYVSDLVIAFKNRNGGIETSYFLPNDFGVGIELCDALYHELIEASLKAEEVKE